jgi:hypothetical protein
VNFISQKIIEKEDEIICGENTIVRAMLNSTIIK